MTNRPPTRPRIKPSEEGYMLIAVMFMLAIFLIALSVAVPKISKQIQRDREVETMRRGKQYVRGIKMYYKKFGAYPNSMDALVQSNNVRFLRKKYIDPTTGKDEWKLIRFGQNKTQTLGFFGQPLAGSMPGIPGSPIGTPGAPGTAGGLGASNSNSSVFGSNSSNSTNGTSTDPGTNPTGSTPGSTDPTTGTSSDPNAPNAPGGTTGTGTGTGLTGQTFGGGGIIGVSPGSPKQSILVYKKKTHYNEWEFFYDPRVEQMMQGGNLGTGLPSSTTGGTTGSGIGGSTGTTGSSTGGTTGGSTPTGGTGATPQQ